MSGKPEDITKVTGTKTAYLPKALRNNLGIEPGDYVAWRKEEGRWYAEKATPSEVEGN